MNVVEKFKSRSSFVLFTCLSVILFSTSAVADVTGRWSCDFNLNGSGSYSQDLLITQLGSTITGQEVVAGTNSPFADITGTISGSSITMHFQYLSSSYFADVQGTVNNSFMSGTWQNNHQNGGFICNKSTSTIPGSPTPTTGPTTSKRQTAITIFCNRTGVGLSTANCSITVADKGAPPRILPTGAVNFFASDGFFPASGSCFLQQTQFSPGIGACDIQLAVPNGFPIGVKFPIDAEYPGDTTFEGSSTSHATINAGCVGDQNNPCSGSVALSFANVPQIIKNAISTVIQCGAAAKSTAKVQVLRSETKDQNACQGNLNAIGKVAKILAEMDKEQLQQLGTIIRQVEKDQILRAMKVLGNSPLPELEIITNDEQKINDTLIKIVKTLPAPAVTGRATSRALSLSKIKKLLILDFGKSRVSVKNNSQKTIKLKLASRTRKVVNVLRQVGVEQITIDLTLKGKRKDTKKSFSAAPIVGVLLN